jgi:TolB-like protein
MCSVVFAIVVVLSTNPAAAQQDLGRSDRSASPSIAIVPFENLTGDAGDEWIGAGIAESLSTGLPGGYTVTLNADAATIDVLEVGRRLDARYAVGGAYQRVGQAIRITGRFVDVTTGAVVRSAIIDGALDELFDLQDRLVAELAGPPPRVAAARTPSRGESSFSDPATTPPPAANIPPPTETSTTSTSAVESSSDPATAGGDPSGTLANAGFAISPDAALLAAIQGPAPPIAPEVVARDAEGRATVRAIKLDEGIRLDGQLDEAVYQSVPAITDFIQQVPLEGAPATEKTEAWIMFDDTNVYISARIWDSAPESEWIANEMRRDTSQLRQNDTFAVFFDTFYDRRNGFNFYTNPLAARADQQFTNEGNPNSDWNPVWDVRTGRFDGGWTTEMEIPFKSLRYRSGSPQLWGVQLRRAIRRKNEWVYLTRLPISAGGGGGSAGIFRVSAAGTLVGMEPPAASRNIEIKPYAIGGTTTDVNANPPQNNEGDGDFGLDVKYGITENLTADLTYNTDFAQVEVDEQQVNLTRFSLFFPEKREFFLEGRGIFDFARGGIGSGFGGGGGFFGGGNAPTLFHSRRIGLQGGQVVPIIGGGRVTGKMGQFDVGALNIQTDDEQVSGADTTNFTVVRVKRDVLRRSAIGGIFTNRSESLLGDGASQAYGMDGTFAFYDNIQLLGYYAKTDTPGTAGENTSYQAKFDYPADRYGLQVDHLLVENNFVPEVGFLRRDNFRRTFVEGRFSPRPEGIDLVRQFRLQGSIDYILRADKNELETRLNQLRFQTELETSDVFGVTINDNYELLLEPFTPGPDVTIPVGGYAFNDVELSYSFGQQRRISGQVSLQQGGFFNGDITSAGFGGWRIAVLPQMSIEPSVFINWIDTPQGSFRTDLAVTRINYAFNPRMFFSGLVQYNSASDTLSNNLRFRWEYSPGSELFVVYTEDRDTMTLRPDRLTDLRNRGFVVKFNKLFRY